MNNQGRTKEEQLAWDREAWRVIQRAKAQGMTQRMVEKSTGYRIQAVARMWNASEPTGEAKPRPEGPRQATAGERRERVLDRREIVKRLKASGWWWWRDIVDRKRED
jgi:hypothetical protein